MGHGYGRNFKIGCPVTPVRAAQDCVPIGSNRGKVQDRPTAVVFKQPMKAAVWLDLVDWQLCLRELGKPTTRLLLE